MMLNVKHIKEKISDVLVTFSKILHKPIGKKLKKNSVDINPEIMPQIFEIIEPLISLLIDKVQFILTELKNIIILPSFYLFEWNKSVNCNIFSG